MLHILPELPYAIDSLEPHISQETLEYHHGKHLKTYIDNLNNLIPWTEYEPLSLEEITKKAPKGPVFNNAAQSWNHIFYFESLLGEKEIAKLTNYVSKNTDWVTVPKENLTISQKITETWGNFHAFQEEFKKSALANFWSGWTWLILDINGKLAIRNTQNAETPLQGDEIPLFVADIWEHAYYIDYRNARAKHIDGLWNIINWGKIEERLIAAN